MVYDPIVRFMSEPTGEHIIRLRRFREGGSEAEPNIYTLREAEAVAKVWAQAPEVFLRTKSDLDEFELAIEMEKAEHG